jgi:hypothetical protein
MNFLLPIMNPCPLVLLNTASLTMAYPASYITSKSPFYHFSLALFSLLQSIPKVPILLIRQIQELLPSRLDWKPIRRQLELPFRILALVYKIQR